MRHTVLACLLAGFAMLLLGSAAERPVEDFTHAVIGEEFTTTWCVYCPSAAENLNKVWQPKSEYPDDPYYHDQFFFVALITDVNDKAGDRAGDYPDFTGYPTVYFDGGDEKVEGGQSDTSNYEQAIDSSGGRSDTDISLRIAMQHLGDDRIAVQVYITWNEDESFGNPDFTGYIRAYIVEPVSRYDNYDGNPYHFGFLDYAFDQQVVLDPHEEVVLETVWIGGEHSGDADDDGDCGDETNCENFSDISYDNLNIFVSFFNDESASADDYALQTAFAIPPQTSFEFPTGNLSDTVSLPGSASQPRSAIAAVEYSVDGSEWQLAKELGPPDFVIEAPPLTVPANDQDQWWVQTTPFEGVIDEPRYVKATELKGSYPLGVRVLHHGHVTLGWQQEGRRVSRPLGRQGIGKGGDLFPDNTGMLIQPSGSLNWNLHYFPIDEEVVDERSTAAVWLHPKGYVPEYETIGEQRFTADRGGDMPWAGDIAIPPHSIKVQQGTHVLKRPALIQSFRPHMHMRGREQSVEAIYPDGQREVLGKVSDYKHIWQISYQFALDQKPLLPKGTVLLFTSVFDNSAANPLNPDPEQWVVFGRRGVDDMSHMWVGITELEQEEFERLTAERRAKLVSQQGQGGSEKNR